MTEVYVRTSLTRGACAFLGVSIADIQQRFGIVGVDLARARRTGLIDGRMPESRVVALAESGLVEFVEMSRRPIGALDREAVGR